MCPDSTQFPIHVRRGLGLGTRQGYTIDRYISSNVGVLILACPIMITNLGQHYSVVQAQNDKKKKEETTHNPMLIVIG